MDITLEEVRKRLAVLLALPLNREVVCLALYLADYDFELAFWVLEAAAWEPCYGK